MLRIYFTTLLLLLLSNITYSQVPIKTLSGKVIDDKNQPIEFASVYYKEKNLSISTDKNGNFSFSLLKNAQNITLKVSFIGKKNFNQVLSPNEINQVLVLELEDFSLSLNEITVSPTIERSNNSNSSITYDREAIQQVQAFSLKDVLNTLPGKATVAPNINNAQTINLRGGDQGGAHNLNNSLGVAIIIDDVVQSNDANMQSRSASRWGMSGSILDGAKSNGSTDVPYQGIDLREIPVESIESIEVIQGVASAKYGELTDGAILIQRQAGKSPYQFTTNINAGSTNYGLTKGFKLDKNWGALNTSLNLAKSNKDPRDRVQQYNRFSGSLMWTKNFSKIIKNTLSVDYNHRSDDVKTDPDDHTQQMSYSKNKNLRLSNRLSANLNKTFAQKLNFTLSIDKGNQESYKQWMLNQGVKTFTNKDTTGIYEGDFISGRYTAAEHILGKPTTISSNLNINTFFSTGSWKHSVGYGFSYNYSNNGGKGIVSDPDRPRWVNSGGQNERPYSFETAPSISNYGLYIEDNITSQIAGKQLNTNIGLRHDIQNGYHTLQPRINSSLELNKKWQLNFAYGIATKAPTLAHRYPSPTWMDITLLSVVNSDQALHLVYTERIDPDNSHLKPSKTTQFETGVRYKDQFITASLFGYYKKSTNGFDTKQVLRPTELPKYAYEIVDSKINYFPTGQTTVYTSLSDYQIYNLTSSDNYGLELSIATKKIKAIQTSFNFSTAFSYNSYFKDAENITTLTQTTAILSDSAWYAIYPKEKKNMYSLMTKVGTTTHIPKIGIVVNFNADVFWLKSENRENKNWREPIGYINNKMETVYFNSPAEIEAGKNTIGLKTYNIFYAKQPMVYGILNMSIAKEIKKNIRISISAYNAISLHPEKYYINPENGQETHFTYNSPTSITGGISIKF